MKHLFMAFMILFSSLSSSWAGVVMSEQQGSSQNNHMMSVMETQGAHDCCPSMHAKAEPSAAESCLHCVDECQCSSNCSLTSPVATLSAHSFHIALIELAAKLPISVSVSQTSLQALDRPPQTH